MSIDKGNNPYNLNKIRGSFFEEGAYFVLATGKPKIPAAITYMWCPLLSHRNNTQAH